MPTVNDRIRKGWLKTKIQQNFKNLFLFLKSMLTPNFHILCLRRERLVTCIAKQIASILVNHCIFRAQLHSIALKVHSGSIFIHGCCRIISFFTKAEVQEEYSLSLAILHENMAECVENPRNVWSKTSFSMENCNQMSQFWNKMHAKGFRTAQRSVLWWGLVLFSVCNLPILLLPDKTLFTCSRPVNRKAPGNHICSFKIVWSA